MQEGFPVLIESKNLWTLYELSGKKILQRNFFEGFRMLLRSCGLHRTDFKIGISKTFFRPVKNLQAILNPIQEMICMTKSEFEKKLAVPIIWKKLREKLLALQTEKGIDDKNVTENM